MRSLARRVAVVGCAFGLAWCAVEAASAASFAFSPSVLELTAKERSGVVTLNNPGDKPIRFEALAMRWEQKPDGQMDLRPTDDVLVYPPLVNLSPSEKRRMRVTVVVPPGELEKSYRIQVTEIPAFQGVNKVGAQITIRSQVDLPVFYAPAVPKRVVAAIANPAAHAGAFTFSITNGGTVRFRIAGVSLTGLGNGGRVVFKKPLEGWYVLAGGHRDFTVPLPRENCSELRAITIVADAGAGSHLSQTVEMPAAACHV